MSDWRYFPPPPPRRKAKDGITARSQRGAIGETWWSKRFVRVLESLTDPNRLRRGRSYARTGQVMGLRVSSGTVTAQVQGSRRAPYAVRIAVSAFGPTEWARVETAMAERAVFMAALLAGEMPRTIEEAFASASLSLFPAEPQDLVSECSCPDWANPCKHVAATYYILAEAFDDDPFLIFAWRGRAKDELITRLRELRAAAAAESGVRTLAALEPSGAAEEEPHAEPLEQRLADFWTAGPELSRLTISPRAAESPDAILRELGPAPPIAVSGRTLIELLVPAYGSMAVAAERRALGEITAGEATPR
jgi:uncharacterized Zn finger protein